MTITESDLDFSDCRLKRKLFQKAFPNGATVTLANARKATSVGLSLRWLARQVMSTEQYALFAARVSRALLEYFRATASTKAVLLRMQESPIEDRAAWFLALDAHAASKAKHWPTYLERLAVAFVTTLAPSGDMERFGRWMEQVRARGLHEKCKILAGVTPLKSVGMATYMRDQVAGVTVPDFYVERLRAADDARREGIQMCVEQIRQLRQIEGVAGVHIMAIEWEEKVPEIVEKAGLKRQGQ